MGINRSYFRILQIGLEALAVAPERARIGEFGSQVLKFPGYFVGPAKLYFRGRGYQHTSYDLNGDWGSERKDLGTPLTAPAELFHMITNFGTSEHVPQQWECFDNAHRFCTPQGIMVHVNPTVGHCAGHGMFTYPVEFFEELAAAAGYELLARGIAAGPPEPRVDHAFAVLRKRDDTPFVSREVFANLPIEVDTQAKNVGDYENTAASRLYSAARAAKRLWMWERARWISLAMRAGYNLGEAPAPRDGAILTR